VTTDDAAPGDVSEVIIGRETMLALNLTAAVLGTALAARVRVWADRRRWTRGGSMN